MEHWRRQHRVKDEERFRPSNSVVSKPKGKFPGSHKNSDFMDHRKWGSMYLSGNVHGG